MFEKVLFPTDFSEYAQKTLECIGEIPEVKEVVLLHIVDATHPSKRGWTHGPHIENARILMEEKKMFLENLGLNVKTKVDVITEGDVSSEILETADKEKVSLIVMGARGRGLIQGLLLGSVSTNVLRHAKTDVLIMRHKLAEGLEGKTFEKFCPMILSKVLYPTDFSESSLEALAFVKDFKGIGELVLMHVVSKGETHEEIEAYVKEAKMKLEDIGKDINKASIKGKTRVHVGSPIEEVISMAEEEDASLVAMSSHGKSWFKELLVGSTTCAVARRAKRPVLVMRTKQKT